MMSAGRRCLVAGFHLLLCCLIASIERVSAGDDDDNAHGLVCPYIRRTEREDRVDTSDDWDEISGLAVSRRYTGGDDDDPVFYAVVDAGVGEPHLGVFDSGNGDRLLTLRIRNQDNIDWESLVLGPCGNDSDDDDDCIYIGDTGSNRARSSGGDRDGRDDEPYRIIKVKEPDWRDHDDGDGISALDHIKFDFRNRSSPTKYADCEAIFVDHTGWGGGDKGDVYVVTKWNSDRRKYNRLFKIPAGAWDDSRSKILSPRAVGDYEDDDIDFMRETWTAADMSRTGTLIALGTERETHIFLRCPGESVEDALAHREAETCRVWKNPSEGQGEGFAFFPDGRSSLQIPEGSGKRIGITKFGYSFDRTRKKCDRDRRI